MKILVTGATGFVGRHLVPALISAGHDVLCAVTKHSDTLEAQQVVVGIFDQHTVWTSILTHIDVVIHLAARVHVMHETAESPLEEFLKVNSGATKNLAEQAAEAQVKRFIFLSSIKVNGELSSSTGPFTETDLPQPQDHYAQSKLQAEHHLRSIAQNTHMDVVILRTPLIFGPGVKANFLKMIQLVDKGYPLPFARIENKRTFLYINNLISAIFAVLKAEQAANQTYLVSDNESWSLDELLSFLAAQLQLKSRLFYLPQISWLFKLPGLNKWGIRLLGSLEISNNKLKTQLNWNPPFCSAEGLIETIKWYRNEYNT